MILRELASRQLDAVCLADPEAGRVDDLVIVTGNIVTGHQVKWSVFAGEFTFNELSHEQDANTGLIRDLADGWKRLQVLYPDKTVRVRLVSNDHAHSKVGAFLPLGDERPAHAHFAAFLAEAWPTSTSHARPIPAQWSPAWNRLQQTSGLSPVEFTEFAKHCFFDFGTSVEPSAYLPEESRRRLLADLGHVANAIRVLVADRGRIIRLSLAELLTRLGWTERLSLRNPHAFPVDPRYEPIDETAQALRDRLSALEAGYLAVVGPPGSGKSSLLAETLRTVPCDVVYYFAFIPGALDIGSVRGEAENFLHDLTLSLQSIGRSKGRAALQPEGLTELRKLFASQLKSLETEFAQTGRKVIVVVDGLDHIEREQRPDQSLLRELPAPSQIPKGVIFVLGTQRMSVVGGAIAESVTREGRQIEMARMTPATAIRVIERAQLPARLQQNQVARVLELVGGHPLAMAYLLNRLADIAEPADVDTLLYNEIPFTGEIEDVYRSHWDSVEGDSIASRLLGLLCRWDGPIDIDWFASWNGGDDAGPALRRMRHFFRQLTPTRWTVFHNSFRLFVLRKSGLGLSGEYDARRDRALYASLAEACEISPEPRTKATALFYWAKAQEQGRVLALATQERFRDQFVSMRATWLIRRDIDLALEVAASAGRSGKFFELILAGFELEQRLDAVEFVDLPSYMFDLLGVEHLVEQLLSPGEFVLGSTRVLSWALRLWRMGLVKDGKRLFEASEPLNLIRGEQEVDWHRGGEPDHALCVWAEGAVLFRNVRDVLESLPRIRRATLPSMEVGNVADDHAEELRAEMLLRAGSGALAIDSWSAFRQVLRAFKRDHPQHAWPLIKLLLETGEVQQRKRRSELASRAMMAAYAVARSWKLPFPWRVDIAYRLHIGGAPDKVIRRVLGEIEPPPLKVDNVVRQDVGLQGTRYRLAALFTALDGEGDLNRFVPDPKTDYEYAAHVVAREEARFGVLAALARDRKLHPRDVLDRCRPFMHVFEQSYDLRLHNHGWWRTTAQRADLLEAMLTSSAAHGQEALKLVAETLFALWIDERRMRFWPLSLRRRTATVLFALGWPRAQVVSILEDVERSIAFSGPLSDFIDEATAQVDAWLLLSEKDRARAALEKMLIHSLRPSEDKDHQMEWWIRLLASSEPVDANRLPSRFEWGTRLIAAMEPVNSYSGSDAAVILLEAAWTRLGPGPAIELWRWLTERALVRFRAGVGTITESAATDPKGSSEEATLAYVALTAWEHDTSPPEWFAKACRTTSMRENVEGALAWLSHTIETHVSQSGRAAWRASLNGVEDHTAQPKQTESVEEKAEQEKASRTIYLRGGSTIPIEKLGERLATVEAAVSMLSDLGSVPSAQGEAIERALAHFANADLIDAARRMEQIGGDGEGLLPLLRILTTRGDRAGAGEIAKSALKRLPAYSWSGWGGDPLKLEASRAIIAALGPSGIPICVSQLCRDLRIQRSLFRSLCSSSSDWLTLFFPQQPTEELWRGLSDYLAALFPEAQESRLGSFAFRGEQRNPSEALAVLLTWGASHSANELSHSCGRSILHSISAGLPMGRAAVTCLVQGPSAQQELGACLLEAAAFGRTGSQEQQCKGIEPLLESTDYGVRCAAHSFHKRVAGTAPPSVKAKQLPNIYRLDVDVPLDLELPEPEVLNAGVVNRDSTNPRRLLNIVSDEIEMLSRMTGLSEGTLFKRAADLMLEIAPSSTWDSKAEKSLQAVGKQIGIELAYRRPRGRVAHRALARLIAEIVDGGAVPPEDISIAARMARSIDPLLYSIRPLPRPPEIGAIRSNAGRYFKATDWLHSGSADDTSGECCGAVVLGEFTELDWLNRSQPGEQRTSGTWLDPYAPKQGTIGSTRWWLSEAYPRGISSTAELGSIVIRAWGYEPFVTEGALMLHPAVGLQVGWRTDSSGIFRWVDRNGNTMVESMCWKDGARQIEVATDDEEVGEGWLVLATTAGWDRLKEHFGTLTRYIEVTRTILGDEGEYLDRSFKKTLAL